ncbi:TRAP transporter substrate-binding protein DctP [Aurantiacibacter odishensis]|uniref:TRAP transporter substrate-binding protein DctP n=1 Tax=Aurantiacibacter odishensis TaxID=1155476 RepID=UPI000E74C00A|nr:TRAP transporter substrate-binding protein DctP [Aurantiacibacter odishensis]
MRLLALLALLVLAACSRPVPEGVTELTYASPYPPSHPFSRADQTWIDFVHERSGGRIKIKPIWSGALLSADMSMTEIRHGVADIGLITPIYTRGGTHLLRTQTGFYSGADSIESQLALYRCMAKVEPQFDKELEGLKLLALQGGVLPGILTSTARVESLADLQGLRIRAPTELLPVLRNLGADPVDLPMGEVYSALAKGVIDGVVAPPETLQSLHFGEVTDYFYDIRIPRGAYPSRAMDMEAWQSLSDAERAILEEGIGVWEAALAEENRAAAAAGEKIAASTITILPASTQDQQQFDDLYLREGQANARALFRVGIDGMTAYRAARQSLVERDTVQCGDTK